MGLLLSNCLKGIHDEFPLSTPYRKSSNRQSQLQSLLSNKSNPEVDGRKISAPPPLPDQSSWGKPSTPQGDDSPGPPTPSSGSSFGYPFSQTNSQQGTATGPPNYNKDNRQRKVSFNFPGGKTDKEKNYM